MLNLLCNPQYNEIKTIIRLGKYTGKISPLLVEFKSLSSKNTFMENLRCLGNAEDILKKISITHDFTSSDRLLSKTLMTQARDKQTKQKGFFYSG